MLARGARSRARAAPRVPTRGGAARSRARRRQRPGDHAMGHERATPHPAFADEGVEDDAAVDDVLDKQVLERLIIERAVLQFAKETGIRVDDTTVERTILRVAEENKFAPDDFRKVLEREGIPYANYREDIRRQIIIQRVRDREVDSKVRFGRRGRQLSRDGRVAGGRRGRIPAVAYLHHRSRAGIAGCRRSERKRAEEAPPRSRRARISGRSPRLARARRMRRRAATSDGARARAAVGVRRRRAQDEAGRRFRVLRSAGGFHVVKLSRRATATSRPSSSRRMRGTS